MSELPPDRSVVAIKSCPYGTYLAACPDYKSVTLQKVDDPNKLPQNCLWTLRRKLLSSFLTTDDSLKFKSCYGRYLAVKGFIWSDLCQDEPVTRFSGLAKRTWIYDRKGATHEKNGYRLIYKKDLAPLWAKNYDQVELYPSGLFISTKPDVYWTIHRVGSNDSHPHGVPDKPHRAVLPSLMEDGEEENDSHKHRCGKGITIINNNAGVPFYNHSTIIDSGKNMNLDGNQCNGGVIAGNKYYEK